LDYAHFDRVYVGTHFQNTAWISSPDAELAGTAKCETSCPQHVGIAAGGIGLPEFEVSRSV